MHVEPLGGDTGLAGVGERRGADSGCDSHRIDVGFDDDRRVIAQLQRHLLPGSLSSDTPAHGRRSGEGDHGYVAVGDEMAGRTTWASHHVHPAPWQSALLHKCSGEKQSGQRGSGGRFEDQRTACGDGRGHLVADQVEREVERSDGPDHTNRYPLDEPGLADPSRTGVHADHVTAQRAGHRGREPGRVYRPGRFTPGCGDRLASLGGDALSKLFSAVGKRGGKSIQDGRPFVGRKHPGVQRLPGRGHRGVQVVGRPGRNRAQYSTIVG